jgi:hypothetical protein
LAVPKNNDPNASFRSSGSRQRSNSQFTPSKSVNGDGEPIQYEVGQHHLMPRPSPRKLGKARDISESPEGRKASFAYPYDAENGSDGK